MADDSESGDPRAATVELLREALRTHDLTGLRSILAADVRWYGNGPGGGCRSRDQVLATLHEQFAATPPQLLEARLAGDRAILEIALPGEDERRWYVMALDERGLIGHMQRYSSEASLRHDLAILAGAALAPAPPPSPVCALVPFVHVADMQRSVAFYALLGFVTLDTFEPEGELEWAFLQSDGARLMLAAGRPIDHRAQAVLFYLYAHDLTGLRDHLVAQGVAPGEIVDGTPGPKQEMRVTDPDGYVLMIAQIDPDA
jgi:hypothetical protein